MFLPLLILATIAYCVFAIVSVHREKRDRTEPRNPELLHPLVKFIVAGGIPAVVVVTMTYLFLIVGVLLFGL